MLDNLFSPQNPQNLWQNCDICNMGCYNLTITSKNNGTIESDNLF